MAAPAEQHAEVAEPVQAPAAGIKGIWARLFPDWKLTNPGKLDNISIESRTVLSPDSFDGAKFDVTRSLSPFFSLGHSIGMGSSHEAPNYHFRATYSKANVLLTSQIDLDGVLSCRYHQGLAKNTLLKVSGQVSENIHHSQLNTELEYDGEDFSLAARAIGLSALTASLFQRVTPNFSAGVETLFAPMGIFNTVSVRYDDPTWVASASLLPGKNISAHYFQKINDKVGFAAELVHSFVSDEHADHDGVTIGYDFNLTQARVQANVHTSGRIACLLEEKIAPGISLLLSGTINYATQKYAFGFGFTMQS